MRACERTCIPVLFLATQLDPKFMHVRQRVWQLFIKDLKKGQTLILHRLDDLMVLGFDKALVTEVTASLVKILVDKGCLIPPKLALAPARSLAWLGKQFDFFSGTNFQLGGSNGGGCSQVTCFGYRNLYPKEGATYFRQIETVD